MKDLRVIFLFPVIIVTFVGCSNPFGGEHSYVDNTTQQNTGNTQEITSEGKASDFVPSGGQYLSSSSGTHSIQQTMGGLGQSGRIVTSGGHIIYQNIQGALFSSEVAQ